MEKRRLPNTELDVSVLCLGTWAFAGTEEKPDATHGFIEGGQEAINAIVAEALAQGINFFDTAEGYADHASERALGVALRASGRQRHEYVIASKFGSHRGAEQIAYTGADIRAALAASLEALGLEYLDLYQCHWHGNMKDVEDSVKTLTELQQEGKIRHYGVCNFGVTQMEAFSVALKAASMHATLATNQLPYNLLWRAIEFEIVPKCEAIGCGIIAYGPFQEGLLLGKYSQVADVPIGRRRTKHFSQTSSPLSRHGQAGAEVETFAAVERFTRLASGMGDKTHVAVAWVLRQPAVCSVVMGCTSVRQVLANVALLEVSEEQLSDLSKATDPLKLLLGNDADQYLFAHPPMRKYTQTQSHKRMLVHAVTCRGPTANPVSQSHTGHRWPCVLLGRWGTPSRIA
jgi:aryl-alcohol dehydrogenase-like predicted oxidoreductase